MIPRHRSHLDAASGQAFADPEGLRALLTRLLAAGPGAWRSDPQAAELMLFARDRYAALARTYGRDPMDAAAAAFEAMLNEATRTADDPWAVVTVAVRVTLIAEHRADGLLTSTDRARRAEYSVFHDAERFSDRDHQLADYHPALHARPDLKPDADEFDPAAQREALRVVDDTVRLLHLVGWPAQAARIGVEYVAARLADIGDRAGAYEKLRRDKSVRALLDLPHHAWIGLLRIVLGYPSAPHADTRRGVLVRLLIGDTLTDLLTDPGLVEAISAANPRRGPDR